MLAASLVSGEIAHERNPEPEAINHELATVGTPRNDSNGSQIPAPQTSWTIDSASVRCDLPRAYLWPITTFKHGRPCQTLINQKKETGCLRKKEQTCRQTRTTIEAAFHKQRCLRKYIDTEPCQVHQTDCKPNAKRCAKPKPARPEKEQGQNGERVHEAR